MRSVLIFAAVIAAVFAAAFASPGAGGDVAVAVSPFAPASRAAEVVAAAEGALVTSSRFGWIVVARAERRDFVAGLYAAVAWLVFDPRIVDACLQKE